MAEETEPTTGVGTSLLGQVVGSVIRFEIASRLGKVFFRGGNRLLGNLVKKVATSTNLQRVATSVAQNERATQPIRSLSKLVTATRAMHLRTANARMSDAAAQAYRHMNTMKFRTPDQQRVVIDAAKRSSQANPMLSSYIKRTEAAQGIIRAKNARMSQLTTKQQKVARGIGNYGMSYVHMTPALYYMHQHHNAQLPEDQKRGFLEGMVMDAPMFIAGDIITRGAMHLAKKIPGQIGKTNLPPKLITAGLAFLERINKSVDVVDRGGRALGEGAHVASSGYGKAPRMFMQKVIASVKSARDEMIKGKPTADAGSFESFENQIEKFSKQIGSFYKTAQTKDRTLARLQDDSVADVVKQVREAYKTHAETGPVREMFNRMLKGTGTKVGVGIDAKGQPLGRGYVEYGGRTYDLHRLSKGRLLGGIIEATRKVKMFNYSVADLFGARFAKEYLTPRDFVSRIHKNRDEFAAFYNVQGNNAKDVIKNFFGAEGQHAMSERQIIMKGKYYDEALKHQKYARASKLERVQLRDQAKGSSEHIVSTEMEIDAVNIKLGRVVLGGKGLNEAIYHIGNKLFLLGKGRKGLYRAQLGYDADSGLYREFTRLQGKPKGVFEKAMLQARGTTKAIVSGDPLRVGFDNGRVLTADELQSESGRLMSPLKKWWYERKRKYELGGSEEPSIWRIAGNYIRKFTDIRSPNKLMSNEGIFNPNNVENMVKNTDDALDVGRRVVDNLESISQRAYLGALKHNEGRTAIREAFRNKGADDSFVDNLLIRDSDTQAKIFSKLTRAKDHFKSLGDKVPEKINIQMARMQEAPDNIFNEIHKVGGVLTGKSFTNADNYNNLVIREMMIKKSVSSKNILDNLITAGHFKANSKYAKYLKAQYGFERVLDDLNSTLGTIKRPTTRHTDNLSASNPKAAKELSRIFANLKSYETDIVLTINKEHGVFSLWQFNPDVKPANYSINNFMIPKPLYPHDSMILKADRTTYNFMGQEMKLDTVKGDINASSAITMSMFDAVNRVSALLGLGWDEGTTRTPSQVLRKMLTKRILPGVTIIGGASLADNIFDEVPIFDSTPLGEGLEVFAANQLIGFRLGTQSVFDATGITDVAQYLEELMPGVIESPGSGLVRGVGPLMLGSGLGMMAGPTGGLIGGMVGGATGLLLGGGPLGIFGEWDISKSRSELIKMYSGEEEVAIRKGRFWETGRTAFEGSCLSKDSKILTKLGYVSISNISIGDKIINNIGEEVSVINKFNRNLKLDENIYDITSSMSNIPITITGNHEILVIEPEYCSVILSHCKKRKSAKCGKCKHRWYKNYKPKYISTEDIDIDKHWIITPINNSYIDSEYLNTYDIITSTGRTYTEYKDYIFTGQYKDKTKIGTTYYRYDKIKYDNKSRLSNKIKLSPAILRLFGFYIAEGELSESTKTISFTFHKKETKYIKDVCIGLDELDLTYNIRDHNTANSTSVIVHHTLFYYLLLCLFGKGSHNKFIHPQLINLPFEKFKYIIHSWLDGDGSYKNNKVIGTSVSPTLISQFQYKLNINGYSTNICKRTRNGFTDYDLLIGSNSLEKLDIIPNIKPGHSNGNTIEYYDYIAYRITSKMKSEYKGKVYDITVSNGSSFQTSIGIVHNSIEYFRPHWYARLRSDYRDAPNFLGNLGDKFRSMFDSDYYAEKHYYSRPYPVDSALVGNIPIVSEIGGVGRQIRAETIDTSGGDGYSTDIGQGSEFSNATTSYIQEQAAPITESSLYHLAGQVHYNITEMVGLKGFAFNALKEKMTGEFNVNVSVPVLESSDQITSLSRWYWGMNIGGALGLSEMVRRFVTKPRSEIEYVNPIRNTMTWLPGESYFINFQNGDPYTSVPEGELRLPGAGYEMAHNVSLSVPLEASMFGYTAEEQAQYYFGDPKFVSRMNTAYDEIEEHKMGIIDQMKAENLIVNDKLNRYNPELDMSSRVDAVINGEFGRTALLFAPMVDGGIAPNGIGGLNAFLNMANIQHGMLIGIDKSTGQIEQMHIQKSAAKFQQDIQSGITAKQIFMSNMAKRKEEGMPDNYMNAYSQVDRLKILSDVAPYSQEYKQAIAKVSALDEAGLLDSRQKIKFKQAVDQRDQRMKGFQSRPNKFYNVGTAATADEALRQQRIEQKYSGLEKLAGGTWEFIRDLRSPIGSKLMHTQHVLDEYHMNDVYGRGFALWQNPIDDFIAPYMNTMSAETDPVQGFVSGGFGGFLLGGGAGAALGSMVGGIYSAVNNATGIGTDIPEYRKRQREINEYFDALEYNKYLQLYETTGETRYKYKAQATITGALQKEFIDSNTVVFAAQKPEKRYIRSILELQTVEERERALQLLPEGIGSLVESYWSQEAPTKELDEMLHGDALPGETWAGYRDDFNLSDLQVKVMEEQGLNTHDVGLGFFDQINRINRYNVALPDSIGAMQNSIGEQNNPADVREAIQFALGNMGTVSVKSDGQSSASVVLKVI